MNPPDDKDLLLEALLLQVRTLRGCLPRIWPEISTLFITGECSQLNLHANPTYLT